ncbi:MULTISPECIES: Sec-independent protein translocase subunit TatA [Kocuria]|jgi:sec-independent protein translocase protein TatA|uniref:Sec-independent protein translocase subunit TatA n=1 Tax=Kocuria TaxID=57493 RepID=UPI002040BC06|nr:MULTISPECIES: Sec-independent protein translocase subunit TatA [Kocuria]MCM3689365.1 Sec-independent protein translocase subunit TatA [Kocuria rosea]HST71343.1 Sec-independent protein translocase subunit TatA [Kocuria rosea]
MGRLFDSPVMLLIILLVILLLFGAPKLPGMARSLGQSLRIFKSEVKEMKKDDQPAASDVVIDGQPVRDGQDVTPPRAPGAPGTGSPQHPDQRPGSPA